VLSVRVPISWVKALRKLETEEVKQQTLVRQALRDFLQAKQVMPGQAEPAKALPG
jgi:hypothetical protein